MIGAGLSGLAAARRVIAQGHDAVVFEKSRGLGGRLATRRTDDGMPIDHGAPALDAPDGTELAAIATELCPNAVRYPSIATPPAYDTIRSPLVLVDGITQFAKQLADGIEIIRGIRITTLRTVPAGFELGDEQGNSHGQFSGVIVSAPAPQAADLLENGPSDPERIAFLRSVAYAPAVMVACGVIGVTIPPQLMSDGRTEVVLRCINESAKRASPQAGESACVVQFTPEYSGAAYVDATDDQIIAKALEELRAQWGAGCELTWTQVKRWRFASCVPHRIPDDINPSDARIVLCGDAVSSPGMEHIYASGQCAADQLLAALTS